VVRFGAVLKRRLGGYDLIDETAPRSRAKLRSKWAATKKNRQFLAEPVGDMVLFFRKADKPG
jgi:hypothetical protein